MPTLSVIQPNMFGYVSSIPNLAAGDLYTNISDHRIFTGTFAQGTSVTLTPVIQDANPNIQFGYWDISGGSKSTTSPLTIIMGSTDITIFAVFLARIRADVRPYEYGYTNQATGYLTADVSGIEFVDVSDNKDIYQVWAPFNRPVTITTHLDSPRWVTNELTPWSGTLQAYTRTTATLLASPGRTVWANVKRQLKLDISSTVHGPGAFTIQGLRSLFGIGSNTYTMYQPSLATTNRIAVTAIPASYSEFTSWAGTSVGDMTNPTTAVFTYATDMMTSDSSLTFEAWFTPTVWPLTLKQVGSGTVISVSEPGIVNTSYADTVSVSVGKELPVILTATPDEGYTFAGWVGDLDPMIDSTDRTIEFIMDGSKNITASFVEVVPSSTITLPENRYTIDLVKYRKLQSFPVPSNIIGSIDGTESSRTALKRGVLADYYRDYSYISELTVTPATGFRRGMRSTTTAFSAGDILQLQGGNPVKKPLLVRVESVSNTGIIESVKILYNTYYNDKLSPPYIFMRLSDGLLTTGITPQWDSTCPCLLNK